MLYYITRSLVRISLHLYCKRIGWEGEENIPKEKPILFAPTHSNSFFDALFIASTFHRSVYCLARGDAFRTPLFNKLLRHFRILPIFRQSENEDNATIKNKTTFQECQDLFLKNAWVLIHPEGFSSHQTHVLALKKGYITMAQNAWAADIDLQIIPVTITYNNFTKWGKKVDIIFQKPIKKANFQGNLLENAEALNKKLYTQLSEDFPSTFQFKGKNILWGGFGQLMYYTGWVVHFPIYFLSQYLGKRFTKGTVFYDSVVVGLLSQLLWVYYLIIVVIWAFL